MDPDENLNQVLRLASKFVYQYENAKTIRQNDAYELAEFVLSLDEWLRKGGFPPKAWTKKR